MGIPRFQRGKDRPKEYADYIQDEVIAGRMSEEQARANISQARLGCFAYDKKVYVNYR